MELQNEVGSADAKTKVEINQGPSVEQVDVDGYVSRILSQRERTKTLDHCNSFYLNSFDSIESLMQLNVVGKKVLTVCGSGEFAQVFIAGGASEVGCFDISPAAIFYSELKYVALCTLSMDEYLNLFNSWLIDNKKDQF